MKKNNNLSLLIFIILINQNIVSSINNKTKAMPRGINQLIAVGPSNIYFDTPETRKYYKELYKENSYYLKMQNIKRKLNYKPYDDITIYDKFKKEFNHKWDDYGVFFSLGLYIPVYTIQSGFNALSNEMKKVYYKLNDDKFNNPYLKEITEQDLKDYNEFIKNGGEYIPKDEK